MRKEILPEKTPASQIPYRNVNNPFRFQFVIPGRGITIEEDANGVCYIHAEGGAGVADLVAGDNITIDRLEDGRVMISAVNTVSDIAAGQNVTIDIDPETGTAVINAITGGETNEHYQGVFDTPQDLIAYDTDPEVGDYGLIKNVTYSDGGDATWNGQYKYCFYINGQWTVVDQMLTFTKDLDLLQQFYSVGGSSPVIYLHEIARSGNFNDLYNVPIVATPDVTVEGDTVTATCATEGAEIWYTTDGSMPHVNGTKYTGPVTASGATTFRFVGVKNGMINSLEAVVGVDYELQPPTVELDWRDGTVTMANPNASGTIYYTTDGSTPTNVSAAYTGPFVIERATTFRLVVIDGGVQSEVTEKQYPKALNVREFSAGVNYIKGRATLIFSVAEDGEAHYELFDTNPTFSSPVSQGTISFPLYDSSNPVWYSIRVFSQDHVPSDVAVSIRVGEPKPTAPSISFDPETNTVSIDRQGETRSIQYQDRIATNGCTIRYTLDGSTPTAQSQVYTGPFQISGNVTVKAVLIAYGQYYSDVATESIVITDEPTIRMNYLDGEITIEGPAGADLYYTLDGSTPTAESTSYSGPIRDIIGTMSRNVKAISVVDGRASGVASAYFSRLVWELPNSSVSYNYLSGSATAYAPGRPNGAELYYGISHPESSIIGLSYLPYPNTGVELDYYSAENPDIVVFKAAKPGYLPTIQLTPNIGYSEVSAPGISIDSDTDLVTISLAGNTAVIPLQTNNNTPDLGARIYYTTDGSMPTSASTLYTRPFTLPEGATVIKAVTVCYGEWESEVSEFALPAPPLFFEAKQAGSTVSMEGNNGSLRNHTIQYSYDGVEWHDWQHTPIDYMMGGTFDVLTLANVGDRVYFKCDYERMDYEDVDSANFCYWILSGDLKMGGDMRSLVGGSDTPRQMPRFYTNAACLTEVEEDVLSGFTSTSYSCFNGMFAGTAITKAPRLPWAVLADKALRGMFSGCSNLAEVECLATDISGQDCTYLWLSGVAENGTFTKSREMDDWTEGADGIPSGWAVQEVG